MSQEIPYAQHTLQDSVLFFGHGLIKDLAFLRAQVPHQHVLIVSETGIPAEIVATVQQAFSARCCQTLQLSATEPLKTLENAQRIWAYLLSATYPRDAVLVAVGGGGISDLTGFAAACYHRGIDYVSIPTTVLAQADAALGGKTGIDFGGVKNSVGAFHPPICVFIDLETLSTLSYRQYAAGLVEIIKHGLIEGSFFNWLEKNSASLLNREWRTVETAIKQSCAIKASIVSQDGKEKNNIRIQLNLGHTFGHAVEELLANSNAAMLHGEAVALGLRMIAALSVERAGLPLSAEKRINDLLDTLSMPSKIPHTLALEDFMAAVHHDKKARSGKLTCVILAEIGKTLLYEDLSTTTIQRLFEQFKR